MLHVISLYSVAASSAAPFVHSIRTGEWHTLARRVAPALVATDLLERQLSPMPPFLSRSSTLFICLDFWSSPEAYRRASQQPACQALLVARRQMASSTFELGEFCFPAPIELESMVPQAVARS
ncbi:MAG: hypothetical protein ABSF70_12990 [Terracidiphilus sp.]|jgi:hypothetical protein